MANKILRRSNNKVLAGVCAGIAEYLGWQAVQVRALFILVFFLGGSSLLIYLILLVIMPAPESDSTDPFNIDDFKSN